MNSIIRVLIVLFASLVMRVAAAEEADLKALVENAIAEVASGHDEPNNRPAFDALVAMLPKVADGRVVVEGDLLLTEHELEDHLAGLAAGVKAAADNPELLLNKHGGVNDFYEEKADRTLSYAVDKASFETEQRYTEMVALMEQATSDWEAVCPACAISFVHDQSKDIAPDTATVNFVVKVHPGPYVAHSFYPHNAGSDRVLAIDPSFYTSQRPQRGLIEHELGHILGYKHEQVRGVPGCGSAGSDFFPLTEYDNQSIMHYFCGGGGNEDMLISETDKIGHRLIYQLASP